LEKKVFPSSRWLLLLLLLSLVSLLVGLEIFISGEKMIPLQCENWILF
jgi:hypothetical protein